MTDDPTTTPKPSMPTGVRIFLVYAGGILALIGLSLRYVIDQAISAPVSPIGVVVMVLMAYTIFTITLVLQRKTVARGLALGLSSLTIPAIPLGLFGLAVASTGFAFALFATALAVLLFRGLLRPEVRAYFDQP